ANIHPNRSDARVAVLEHVLLNRNCRQPLADVRFAPESGQLGSVRRMGKAKRAHHLFAAEVRVGNGQAPLPTLRNWVREFEPISGLGAVRAYADRSTNMNAEPFSMSGSTARLGRIAVLCRGRGGAGSSATRETSRFKAVFAALADVGVDAEPVVYEDDVLEAVHAQLAIVDGVLVWVNPIHKGRNRANLDALLRQVAARGVWVSAHPDVILKMGTKEVLHRTRTMSWGSDTALYRTTEAMRVELPARLAAGPRVIKRNRGNGGQGVWKVETLAGPRNRPMV